jgi:hypothetical protein
MPWLGLSISGLIIPIFRWCKRPELIAPGGWEIVVAKISDSDKLKARHLYEQIRLQVMQDDIDVEVLLAVIRVVSPMLYSLIIHKLNHDKPISTTIPDSTKPKQHA